VIDLCPVMDDVGLLEIFNSFRYFKDEVDELKEWRPSIDQRFDALIQMIHNRNNEDFLDDFVPLELALKKLNMSKRTLDSYREKGEIGYIKVGKKIMLLKTDIKEFLMTHYIPKLETKTKKNENK
jgi:hypothetical protein